MTLRLRKLTMVVLVAVLVAMLSACPKDSSPQQRQQIAQASKDASDVALAFQSGELNLFQQGKVSPQNHLLIQGYLKTLSKVGVTLDSCIKSTIDNAGVVACANSATVTIDQLFQDGSLHLKSEEAKTAYLYAMLGTRTAIAVITTVFGGTAPPAPQMPATEVK